MSLHAQLQQRAADGKPIRIGLIGAGKFGSMYLAQVPRTPGVHLAGIADLSPANARANLARVGWEPARTEAASLDAAIRTGTTHIGDDWQALVRHPGIDVIVECTGHPIAAVDHCLEAFAHGKHVVNVTVEADAFCGPLLARRAAEAGVVYSLAFGDQPALICDLVDWARTCGFPVVAAGRGHKWLPHFCESTPETVWGYYGLTPEQAQRGGLNPKMFNSFLDGSKPSIESTAVANATGLGVPSDGLLYPPASVEDIPYVTRPRSEGGVLERKGMVEVISSLEADGRRIPYDIRMGVWVTVEAETEYIRQLLRGIQRPHRPQRALLHPVQALAPDRAGGRPVGRLRGPARRADRRRDGLACRRGRHRQARPEPGRVAGRRRRLHRLGQAAAGGPVGADGWVAAGPGARHPGRAAGRQGAEPDLGRRRHGHRHPGLAAAPPDGRTVRPAAAESCVTATAQAAAP